MLTLEQIIEAARHLVPTDRQQLQRWLQKQEALDAAAPAQDAEASRKETSKEQMERFRKAMNWIAEHRAEYLNQWVVLVGDQLISHGLDGHQVDAEARAAGIKAPFLVHVLEEPEAYCGGWL